MKYVFIDNSGSMIQKHVSDALEVLKTQMKQKYDDVVFVYVNDRVYVEGETNIPSPFGSFWGNVIPDFMEGQNLNPDDCVFITDGEIFSDQMPKIEVIMIDEDKMPTVFEKEEKMKHANLFSKVINENGKPFNWVPIDSKKDIQAGDLVRGVNGNGGIITEITVSENTPRVIFPLLD